MEQYHITGMSCAACSARIEKEVSKVDGVTTCSVNLLTNSMGVEGTASEQAIIAAVEHAGYGATKESGQQEREGARQENSLADRETPVLLRRLIASVCFLLVLMYISMGHTMWNFPLPVFLAHNPVALGLIQLLLTICIMIINQKFFVSGVKALLHRAPNMDTLVAMGSGAAFVYSTYALFVMTAAQAEGDQALAMQYMHEFYFESAAMILTLITVGKTLESYSKGKTTNALKSLMGLAPQNATVERGGTETVVPVEQVRQGDVFLVRPGETIPVDGVVLEGSSAVNESALTGESLPVDKKAEDVVSAGTMNLSGFLKCTATRVGQDTTLSQIIQMVSDAAATKAPVAKAADRVSAVFVPVVLILAAITAIVWLLVGKEVGFVLARAISVLVISCPCALGLATPVAIMVGNGLGAKNGILFKTSSALEAAGKVEIVALDKTGTITSGEPSVTDVLPAAGSTAEALLATACTLEKNSEHPLAKAVMRYGEAQGLVGADTTEFRILPGNGLTALQGEDVLAGGNLDYIKSQAEVSEEMIAQAEGLAEQGKTPLFFSRAGKLLGLIGVADVIKEDSIQAIRELRDMGLRVVMLTGDNARTAKAIGQAAGVDEIIAGVLPEGKERAVRTMQQTGRVAMVGDGINDAPALTRADVGIAIGAGTDVAMDAADVVLMKSNLIDVLAAIRLSKATLRNIHENLFWAFFYNVIGIPLAAGVWIPLFDLQLNPMFAAAAMSLSSVCVVVNALRLNWFQPYRAGKVKLKKAKQKKEKQTMKVTMKIEGMMCGHCEARVKKCLEAIDGVEKAEVSHETGTAEVTLSKAVSNETLKQAVEAQDYTVVEIS